MTKYCCKCDRYHPLSDFGKDRNKSDGLKTACKNARNKENRHIRNKNPEKHRATNLAYSRTDEAKFMQWARSLKRKFWPQLSVEDAVIEYNKLLVSQNDRCGLCKKHKSEFKMRLAVDHCHSSKIVRGLLCNKCNRFEVGRHTVETAREMLAYLEIPLKFDNCKSE